MSEQNQQPDWNPATRAVHAGYEPTGEARPLTAPVTTSAAYSFTDHASSTELFALRKAGFTYSRTGNPTVAVLEKRLAALEGGRGAVATASGQSAVALALLALLQGPRHLVASSRLYGGTVDLLTDTFVDFGIEVTFVDPLDLQAWESAIRPDTVAFLLESVTNPQVEVIDLEPLAELAHAHDVSVVVDNTLATPWAYRPLEHGADVVVHSVTKGLGGHGSALGGAVIAGTFDLSDPERFPQIAKPRARYYGDSLLQKYGDDAYLMLVRSKFLHDLGPTLSASSASALAQGIESLPARAALVASNVQTIAAALQDHPAVARVHHTSLPSHPQHELAARAFPRGTGCLFGLELVDAALVPEVIDRLELIQFAANIGDTRTLVSHPATMTHCRFDASQLAAAGISPALLRISVGLEDTTDLLADLTRALDGAHLARADRASSARADRAEVSA
ncbi:MAG: O-acetylhomoserine aminocarboxypropyltransferase/cysteine synthase family protein [Galactobacter sp.]|uniref:O-acetylhomoserine aminocarboxypropyltransferase/cysteine synthase family protein n=1 Tax=Galactobacter sp. TaxID=2676125 RepID=UPI0025BBF302|nr:aminotransferase class I/II-fold pyridoxal phosphate-dependent enzyme [Galactobacter sp.]